MRLLAFCLVGLPVLAAAQSRALSSADSTLIHRILAAEDRRAASDPALASGLAHGDERVRFLARRATWRIADSLFAARDSMAAGAQATRWPENPWRARYRAMAAYRDVCDVVALGLRDSTWQVRLRAADMVRTSCAPDERIVATLRSWLDSLPADVSRRSRNGVSWHAAAHAIVALARLRPDDARRRIASLASHPEWHLRAYAARAAGAASDTAILRALAADVHDNVKEAAIENLSRLGGHAFDDVYVAALGAQGAQAVRAAAMALKGSPRADVRRIADSVFANWRVSRNESERDVRTALLEAAGRAPGSFRLVKSAVPVPREAVALALGADVRLRVEMDSASGGGSFVVKLRGDLAPIMASRILGLARSGYYDGGTWWRVEHDFVIQGGARGDNEYVGHADFLRDELANLPHPRGTIGMSTRGHDTGDAQWFINMRDNPRLIRDFTIFAEVVEGMDVVDQVQEGDRIRQVTIPGESGRPAGRSSRERSSPARSASRFPAR